MRFACWGLANDVRQTSGCSVSGVPPKAVHTSSHAGVLPPRPPRRLRLRHRTPQFLQSRCCHRHRRSLRRLPAHRPEVCGSAHEAFPRALRWRRLGARPADGEASKHTLVRRHMHAGVRMQETCKRHASDSSSVCVYLSEAHEQRIKAIRLCRHAPRRRADSLLCHALAVRRTSQPVTRPLDRHTAPHAPARACCALATSAIAATSTTIGCHATATARYPGAGYGLLARC